MLYSSYLFKDTDNIEDSGIGIIILIGIDSLICGRVLTMDDIERLFQSLIRLSSDDLSNDELL